MRLVNSYLKKISREFAQQKQKTSAKSTSLSKLSSKTFKRQLKSCKNTQRSGGICQEPVWSGHHHVNRQSNVRRVNLPKPFEQPLNSTVPDFSCAPLFRNGILLHPFGTSWLYLKGFTERSDLNLDFNMLVAQKPECWLKISFL